MASHNSTPQSVLDAPRSTPKAVTSQLGYSRGERRQPVRIATLSLGAQQQAITAGANRPHESGKVRKVRRGRKARWNR